MKKNTEWRGSLVRLGALPDTKELIDKYFPGAMCGEDKGADAWIVTGRENDLRIGVHASPFGGHQAMYIPLDANLWFVGLKISKVLDKGIVLDDISTFLNQPPGTELLKDDSTLVFNAMPFDIVLDPSPIPLVDPSQVCLHCLCHLLATRRTSHLSPEWET